MTVALQRLWNKPIRTETNSVGPGSSARPFTTSHRTNECVPSIVPSTLHFHPFHFFPSTPGHHEVFDFLSSAAPTPASSTRPFFFVPR